MSNQANGLRFDVYERVHLPDDVAAIDELEEIELVPRIQVIDQGDQAVLKGQLLLSGVYRSQNAIAGPLTLEHWIPVEISLPMNRVSRLDDISIEIDNFDVDLISARTLNITGVLSLRGISVDPVEETPGQQWEEEPFTATHEREAPFEQPFGNGFSGPESNEAGAAAYANAAQAGFQPPSFEWTQRDYGDQAQAVQEEQGYIADDLSSALSDGGQREITIASQQTVSDSWLQWSALAEAGQKAQQSPQFAAQDDEAAFSQPWFAANQPTSSAGQAGIRPEEEIQTAAVEPQSSDTFVAEIYEEPRIEQVLQAVPAEPINQEPEPEPEGRQQQEVQIAFAGKPSGNAGEPQADVGFRALLQSSRREQAAREAAEQESFELEAQNASRTAAVEEEIEWKKLFLSKQAGENEFRKIRMCIVQKEETLEQIAIRYSLNPREILTYNRLHESAVEEGQLLYIP
ncbi:LysM peptidoglycan-binding domain-containing protein [Paenibacillus sp. LHD-117]|uniref:LysM peptidoglycan-binding domain-containing protein n=1 Tax=Paenibacillus sp. LHD-117 TaxID=3071412 RepID=UPI0027DF9D2D|nr:LysM peptidoglycan-binding domain-containing protein [Paenibacillus sp. LHD-117]MDQ6418637.1 LysM peptidoglycan-binding domain-containing protein [Paenibacillus sp. LHD-117]